MKMAILITGLYVVLSGLSLAQTNTNKLPPVDVKAIVLPDPLVTAEGENFDAPKLQRITPSEIDITGYDDSGVLQSKLIKISDLPDDLKKQLRYDTNSAARYDAAQAKIDAKYSPRTGMSKADLQRYYYNSTIDRRIDEINAEIAAEQAAEKAREEERKERLVAAQEKAAEAAEIQAENPPIINQTTVILQKNY